jgi:hypothetical protein
LYLELGRPDRAEPLARSAVAVRRQHPARDPKALAGSLAILGQSLAMQGRCGEAEQVLRESETARETEPQGDWTRFQVESLLGAALLGERNLEGAEPLLVRGYEGLKGRERDLPLPWGPIRLTEALERLVQLYDAWGKKDQADDWRRRLTEMKSARLAETEKD